MELGRGCPDMSSFIYGSHQLGPFESWSDQSSTQQCYKKSFSDSNPKNGTQTNDWLVHGFNSRKTGCIKESKPTKTNHGLENLHGAGVLDATVASIAMQLRCLSSYHTSLGGASFHLRYFGPECQNMNTPSFHAYPTISDFTCTHKKNGLSVSWCWIIRLLPTIWGYLGWFPLHSSVNLFTKVVASPVISLMTVFLLFSMKWMIFISHRMNGAGIYANIGGILMVNVTIYGSTMDPMGVLDPQKSYWSDRKPVKKSGQKSPSRSFMILPVCQLRGASRTVAATHHDWLLIWDSPARTGAVVTAVLPGPGRTISGEVFSRVFVGMVQV